MMKHSKLKVLNNQFKQSKIPINKINHNKKIIRINNNNSSIQAI